MKYWVKTSLLYNHVNGSLATISRLHKFQCLISLSACYSFLMEMFPQQIYSDYPHDVYYTAVLLCQTHLPCALFFFLIYKSLSSPSPLSLSTTMGTFSRRGWGLEAGAWEAHDWARGRTHSNTIGCEPLSCEQSSLLIPESISEQLSGTCCVRDAHQILLFVLVSLIGTIWEQTEDTVR